MTSAFDLRHLRIGFTYLRNRWYDPNTGRFLTQDPIGLAGGVNLYAYAGGNPVAFSDPFGLCPPFDSNDGPHCPTQGMTNLSEGELKTASEESMRPEPPSRFYVSGYVMKDNIIVTATAGAGGGVEPSVCLNCAVPVGAGVAVGIRYREPKEGEIVLQVSRGVVGVSNTSVELQFGTPVPTVGPAQVTATIAPYTVTPRPPISPVAPDATNMRSVPRR